MTEQQQNPTPNNDDEVVPIPPKSSGGGNKLLVIILGVIVACVLIFGVLASAGVWYLKSRGANIIRDVAKTQGVDIGDIDVKTGKGEIRIKTDDGEAVASVGPELPDGFPSQEITIYDGKIKSSNRFKSDKNTSWSVVVETQDSSDAIKQSIKKELDDNGWKSVMEQDSDGSHMRIVKKESYNATVSWGKPNDDGIMRISYMITETPPKEVATD